MRSRPWRILDWIGSTIGCWVLAIIALVYHHPWALHIWVFWTWISIIVFGVLCIVKLLYVISDMKDKYEAVVPTVVPWYISTASDVLMASLMAAYGHWFYAALVFVGSILERDARTPFEPDNVPS